MIIEFKFDIGDYVCIKKIKKTGRILDIWITKHGVEYNIRYYNNQEYQTNYFYENELSKESDVNKTGFKV